MKVRRFISTFCTAFALFIVLMVQYQFGYLRYHYEYAFQAIKWHLSSECPRPTSTNSIFPDMPVADWNALIEHQLEKIPDRWVVFKPPVTLGLCNRILNSISAFMLAMAINRTLWLEWEQQDGLFITSNEFAGMSSFDDLFASRFHDERFRPPSALIEDATTVSDCIFEKMLFIPDLNQEYNQRVIRIDRGDWWGSLLFHNPAYASTVFKGLKPMDGFPLLFRALFTLHPPIIEPEPCSWMIQYRVIWPPPRYTAPIETFLACAREKGMTPADYRTTWIVTDDPAAMLEQASPEAARALAAMNIPRERTCRGPCGDRQAMETMHRLSRCRNALLTLGSSFGSCIASLANAPRQFRVSHFGECLPLDVSDGPLDINTYSRHGNLATYLADHAKRIY